MDIMQPSTYQPSFPLSPSAQEAIQTLSLCLRDHELQSVIADAESKAQARSSSSIQGPDVEMALKKYGYTYAGLIRNNTKEFFRLLGIWSRGLPDDKRRSLTLMCGTEMDRVLRLLDL